MGAGVFPDFQGVAVVAILLDCYYFGDFHGASAREHREAGRDHVGQVGHVAEGFADNLALGLGATDGYCSYTGRYTPHDGLGSFLPGLSHKVHT